MPKKKKKSMLKLSITLFIIVALISLAIILNKGYIGSYNLVVGNGISEVLEEKEEEHKMELISKKRYISSATKEKAELTVRIDGIEEIDGIELVSSDESIITIENGFAKAVKNGMATITATKDGLTASVNIRVITPIKTLKLSAEKSAIEVGEDLLLTVNTTPAETTKESLVFSSTNESIATVDANGVIVGVSKGKATFTVYDEYTKKESSTSVTVK